MRSRLRSSALKEILLTEYCQLNALLSCLIQQRAQSGEHFLSSAGAMDRSHLCCSNDDFAGHFVGSFNVILVSCIASISLGGQSSSQHGFRRKGNPKSQSDVTLPHGPRRTTLLATAKASCLLGSLGNSDKERRRFVIITISKTYKLLVLCKLSVLVRRPVLTRTD